MGGGVFFEQGRIWVSGRSDGLKSGELVVSSDTGVTWTAVNNVGFSRDQNASTISFCSKDVGVIPAQDGIACFVTLDGGLTWQKTPSYSGGNKLIAVSSTTFVGNGNITKDGGSNWSWFPLGGDILYPLGKDNAGNIFCVGMNGVYLSIDSGNFWIRYPQNIELDSWSMSGHTSCDHSVIYLANEDNIGLYSQGDGTFHTNHLSDIYFSRDSGKSFIDAYSRNLSDPSNLLTGKIIAARHGVAYCATYSEIIRTTNSGNTWQNIGGPGGILDGSSFALINDSTIVALDTLGNVWITNNSGGFPMPKLIIHRPFAQGFSLTNISSCDSGKGQLTLAHQFCAPLVVNSFSIDPATSTHFSIGNPLLPDTLQDGKSIVIPVSFIPNTEPGNFTGKVRLSGYYIDDGDTIRIDTSISFSAESIPVGPKLQRSTNFLDMGNVSLCGSPVDTVITLTNKGCDTLSIISGPGALSSEFTILTALNLPIDLPPDSFITIRFRFMPSGVGTFGTTAHFRAEQQGLTQDIDFDLSGKGTPGDGIFAYEPKQFDFNTLSICSRDSGSGFVTNIGCATVSFDNMSFLGNADYTVPGISAIPISPGDTLRYAVYLNPQLKGIRTGAIVLTTTNKSGARRDTIPLTVKVIDGTKILAGSPPSIDFGTTNLCNELDSVITLYNKGCDTLQVSGDSSLGTGFRVEGVGYPINILPGDSVKIKVTTFLDTTGGKMTNTGSISFISNADDTIPPITFTRSVTLPKTYSLHLGMPVDSAKADEIVRLAVIGEKGLGRPGSGVKQIDFDLSLNEDLLDFIMGEGVNVVSKNGKHITISNPTELASDKDTLGYLRYIVMLTKDSSTAITLSNLTLNNNDTSACAPKIVSQTAESFTYIYQCGDHFIQHFLRGDNLPLKIVSLKPNPAQNELAIELDAAEGGVVQMEIYDELGKRVMQREITFAKGKQSVSLSTADLPEGMYSVRMGNVSGRFVKVK
jgi:hypothetical protein